LRTGNVTTAGFRAFCFVVSLLKPYLEQTNQLPTYLSGARLALTVEPPETIVQRNVVACLRGFSKLRLETAKAATPTESTRHLLLCSLPSLFSRSLVLLC
jgi:hypothetical protein